MRINNPGARMQKTPECIKLNENLKYQTREPSSSNYRHDPQYRPTIQPQYGATNGSDRRRNWNLGSTAIQAPPSFKWVTYSTVY